MFGTAKGEKLSKTASPVPTEVGLCSRHGVTQVPKFPENVGQERVAVALARLLLL